MNCPSCIYFSPECEDMDEDKTECEKYRSKNMQLIYTDGINYKFEEVK